MADAVDQEIDALLGSHSAEVETERKNDARTAVHSPEQRADAVFGRFVKFQIPQQKLPIERPAFAGKWRREESAIRAIARRHESLQLVAWDQLVKHGRAGKRYVVAAHA